MQATEAARILAARYHPPRVRCATCDAEFQATHNRSTYCSAHCKYLARYAREEPKRRARKAAKVPDAQPVV